MEGNKFSSINFVPNNLIVQGSPFLVQYPPQKYHLAAFPPNIIEVVDQFVQINFFKS